MRGPRHWLGLPALSSPAAVSYCCRMAIPCSLRRVSARNCSDRSRSTPRWPTAGPWPCRVFIWCRPTRTIGGRISPASGRTECRSFSDWSGIAPSRVSPVAGGAVGRMQRPARGGATGRGRYPQRRRGDGRDVGAADPVKRRRAPTCPWPTPAISWTSISRVACWESRPEPIPATTRGGRRQTRASVRSPSGNAQDTGAPGRDPSALPRATRRPGGHWAPRPCRSTAACA